MKKHPNCYRFFFVAIVLLSAGLINYLLFNPNIAIFHFLGLAYHPVTLENPVLMRFFSGYFSDLTWCSSLCIVALTLLELKRISINGKWALMALPFISEILQYLKLIAGTFDWLDILAYAIVITLFSLLFPKFKLIKMKKCKQVMSAAAIAILFMLFAIASAPSKQVTATKYNGVFKMPFEKDEAVTNAVKLQNLRLSANPSIVLRVPNASREVTQEDNNIKVPKTMEGANNLNDINVYNVIEKELLKGGFTVRDRALFEKVLGDKNVSDYSKIKELTETDLILELSSIEYVKYPANYFNFYSTTRRKGTVQNTIQCSNYFNLYGLKLEFRLIQVKDNDFIGSFTYYYNPCGVNPCNYSINVGANNSCSVPYIDQGNGTVTGTNLISRSDIEDFVEASTSKMVQQIFNKQ